VTINQRPKVITIAAVSGGGKTTITNQLNDKLINSTTLYFDDYDFKDCPEDIVDWVEKGANNNEWNHAPLVQDLRAHLNNENQTFNYILLDYPSAYLNSSMREYIDFTIYIDTPLDIAMARRIVRDFSGNPNDILNDLSNYLFRGRTAYLEMIKSVKPDSDIVIDGSIPITDIVDKITKEIRNRDWTSRIRQR
jgi:uridine kinase